LKNKIPREGDGKKKNSARTGPERRTVSRGGDGPWWKRL